MKLSVVFFCLFVLFSLSQVQAKDVPPFAVAEGPDLVVVGKTISLNGSNSSDGDNDPLEYRWSLIERPDGSSTQLDDPTSATPTALLDRSGIYIFELKVIAGGEESSSDFVSMTAVKSNGGIVFGPEEFEPSPLCKLTKGAFGCEEEIRNFTAIPGTNYTVLGELIEGEGTGIVRLNSTKLPAFYRFGINNEEIGNEVELLANNEIGVLLTGSDSKIEFTVRVDQLPIDQNNRPVLTGNDIVFSESGTTQLNITDADAGDLHIYKLVREPLNGTVEISGSGLVTYTANTGFGGVDTFSIAAFDNGEPVKAGVIEVKAIHDGTILAPTIIAPPIFTNGEVSTTQLQLFDNGPNQTHSFSVHSPAGTGTTNTDSNGLITFTPAFDNEFLGTAVIKVTTSDGSNSIDSFINVEVNQFRNTFPTEPSEPLFYDIDQGEQFQKLLEARDPDPGQSLSYSISIPPERGVATITPEGDLVYIPEDGQTGSFSMVVRVIDNTVPAIFGEVTFGVTVNIAPGDFPFVSFDRMKMLQGESESTQVIIENPSANYTYSILQQPANGSASVDQNGLIGYVPISNFVGEETFILRVVDDNVPQNVSDNEVKVEVVSNPAPVLFGINSYFLIQGEDVTGSISFFDSDGGDAWTYSITQQGTKGVATIDQNGDFVYQSNPGEVGTDVFTVGVTDNFPFPATGTKNITINIEQSVAPEIFSPDTLFLTNTESKTFNFSASDQNTGQTITKEISTLPINGTATLSSNGQWVTYTPNSGFSGTDALELKATDSGTPSLSATKIVTFNVEANVAPTISIADFTTVENETGQGFITFGDANQGQFLTLSISGAPQNGTAGLSGSTLFYTPNPDFFGQDSIQITVTDSGTPNLSTSTTVAITVEENIPPVVSAGSIDIFQGFSGSTILNITDSNSTQTFTSELISNGSKGVVTQVSTYEYFYEPDLGSTGLDQFQVRVTDSGGATGETTIDVNITANTIPMVTATDIEIDQNTNGTSQVGFIDPDTFQDHTFSVVQGPVNGNVTIDDNGLVLFQPNLNFDGNDTIIVGVTDSALPPDTGTHTINVTVNPNRAPTVEDEIIADAVSGMSLDIPLEFEDLDQTQTLTFTIETSPSNGTATVDQNGLLNYQAPIGFTGTVSIDVKIEDNGFPVLSDTANISITVVANEAPVVSVADIVTNKNVPATTQMTFTDVNFNRQVFTQEISVAPTNGIASIDSNGLITYMPNTDFFGVDSLEVRVTDNGNPALNGTKLVNISINDSSNTPPTISEIVMELEQTIHQPYCVVFFLEGLSDNGSVTKAEWDFGDGTSLVVDNPADPEDLEEAEKCFLSLGAKNITVTLTDDEGAMSTFNDNFTVSSNDLPLANWTASVYSGNVNDTVNFTSAATDADGTIVEHEWIIEGPNTDFSDFNQNTSFTFTEIGQYEVCLFVIDDSNGFEEKCRDFYIGQPSPSIGATPIARIIQDKATGAVPLTVNFDASLSNDPEGVLSYEWRFFNFDNPLDRKIGANVSHTFYKKGTFGYQLIVTDSDGNETFEFGQVHVGSTAAPSLKVLALQGGPLGINFSGELSEGLLDHETAVWDFGDGNTFEGNFFAQHTYTSAGTYTVNLTIKDRIGRESSVNKVITIDAIGTHPDTSAITDVSTIPVGGTVNFDATGSFNPNGGDLNYRWDFADGTLEEGLGSSFETRAHVYNSQSFVRWSLVVTDVNGLDAMTNGIIGVSIGDAPVAIANVTPTTGTAPLTVSLDATASTDSDGTIASYFWRNSNQIDDLISFNATDSFTLTQADNHQIELFVTDNDGNIARTEVFVFVDPPIVNSPPSPSAPSIATAVDMAGTSQVVPNDPDLGQSHTYSIVSQGTNGTASVDVNGLATYVPNLSFVGSDSFVVRVTDNGSPILSGDVTVNVTVSSATGPTIDDFLFEMSEASLPVLAFFEIDFSGPNPIVEISMDFGDGSPVEVHTDPLADDFSDFYHGYTSLGAKTVTVTVKDDQNNQTQQTYPINVVETDHPVIRVTSVDNFTGTVGAPMTFDASTTSDADGVSYIEWEVDETGDEADGNTFTTTFNAAGEYTIFVLAADNNGAFKEVEFKVYIDVPKQNLLPFVASTTTSRLGGLPPFSVTVDSSDSFDPDDIIGFLAHLTGDDRSPFFFYGAANATWTYNRAGQFKTTLVVEDDNDALVLKERFVYVDNNFPPDAFFFAFGETLTINFEGHSDGLLDSSSYFWDFGDGNGGVGKFPVHTFATAGTYNVELTVIDIQGRSSTFVQPITVSLNSDVPQISLLPAGDQIINVGQSIVFDATGTTDAGGGQLNYIYDFADNGDDEGVDLTSSTYTFNNPMYSKMWLIVTNDRGLSSRAERLISVVTGNAPVASFTATPLSGTAPLLVDVDATASSDSDGTIEHYQWNYDQDPLDLGEPPVYDFEFENPGTYVIQLLVQDDDGNVSKATQTINVTAKKDEDSVTQKISGRKKRILKTKTNKVRNIRRLR